MKMWAPYTVKAVVPVTREVGGQEHPTGKSVLKLLPCGGRSRPLGRCEQEIDTADAAMFKVGDTVLVTIGPYTLGMAPFGREA